MLKNIAVRGDTLYVSIASTCNVCVSDTESDPLRGAIYRYDAAGHNAGRALVARGIRNAEGLAFVPGTDELWAVVNNRDNILVPDDRDADGDGKGDRGKHVDRVRRRPPAGAVHPRAAGRQLRLAVLQPEPRQGPAEHAVRPRLPAQPRRAGADCATATPVDVGIQAHSAPLGLTFTQGTAAPDVGAVVALHGSWNRTQADRLQGHPLPVDGRRPGEQADLVTGFEEGPASRGAARSTWRVEPSGSLLVSDDLGGAVIRLTPP